MYKVIAVDDEIWVLRGLERLIDWNSMGFEFVCGFSNAIQALEKIQQLTPDIVITDIRMAGLNGLEFVKSVQNKGMNPKFVLLSAYSDFSYAQEAIRLGVSEYIVKPIQKEVLQNILSVIRVALDHNLSSGNKIYSYLLTNKNNFSKTILLEMMGIQGKYDKWCCICIQKEDASIDTVKKYLNDFLFGKKIEFCSFNAGDKFHIFILNYSSNISGINQFLYEVADKAEINTGISCSYSEIDKLPKALNEAKIAYLQFYIGDCSYLNEFTPKKNNMERELVGKFENLFNRNQQEIIKNLIKEIPSIFVLNSLTIENLFNVYNCIIGELRNTIMQNEVSLDNPLFIARIEDLPENFPKIQDLCESLLKVVNEVFNCIMISNERTISNKIDIYTIKKYIDENFLHDITVNQIANKFHMNTEYLSRLFKHKLGYNLNHYITQKRIQHSCILLTNTRLQIDEIVVLCGYNDYFYFNKVFKKMIGMTPFQYRTEKNSGNLKA